MIDSNELAVAEGITEDTPETLWCVMWLWESKGQASGMRFTNWFASEERACNHAEWVADGRGKVLSVTRYVRTAEEELVHR